MKSIFVTIGLACGSLSLARADFNPVPLAAGSFNADVVVEKTAAPPIENFVTACPDGGTNLTGNVWFETGYYPSVPGWGLPAHGTTFVAQDDPTTNHAFMMPPDYTVNNALFISGNNGPGTGTLNLVSPAAFSGLSILNSSGNGGETINYTVHHQDGTTDTGSFVSADWFHGVPASWPTHCLVSVNDGSLQQIGGNAGDLYYNDITVSPASPVISIDFAWGGTGGRMNVFAISGATDGVAFTNTLALTGFNYDMVVESNAPNFSMNVNACTATMERGTNLWGKVYFEQGFGGQTSFGLPPRRDHYHQPGRRPCLHAGPELHRTQRDARCGRRLRPRQRHINADHACGLQLAVPALRRDLGAQVRRCHGPSPGRNERILQCRVGPRLVEHQRDDQRERQRGLPGSPVAHYRRRFRGR